MDVRPVVPIAFEVLSRTVLASCAMRQSRHDEKKESDRYQCPGHHASSAPTDPSRKTKSWNLFAPDWNYWVMAIRTDLADTYIESYGQLRNVASRFVQQDEADDMVQEAYVRALACGDEFRGESAPTTWLYRILVNACLDVRRCRQRRGVHVTLEETRSAPRGRRGYRLVDRHALRTALATLGSAERDVCVMYDVMGYTHPEISRRLGIPVGTSKGRLCSARRRLRRLLAP